MARLTEPAIDILHDAAAIMTTRGNLDGVIELLADEQTLVPTPPNDFLPAARDDLRGPRQAARRRGRQGD